MSITHDEQREKWNEEHAHPYALVQMDDHEASGSVLSFLEFLKKQKMRDVSGVEMGCGKGRNVIGCAKEGFVSVMHGFDFSDVAILEAARRATSEDISGKTDFKVMDATERWEYPPGFFDFGIDCAASTDIEDAGKRQFAISEMFRVLKPGGFLLVYAMSTDDAYHKLMREKSPAEETGAFYHPETGKFEKVFSEEELDALYTDFALVEKRRLDKTARFFGVSYPTRMHWRVYRKA